MTNTTIQKSVDTLSTCPLFAGMTPVEIHRLLAGEGCRLVHYPAGSEIPPERGMLLLLSGSVLIEKQAADGVAVVSVVVMETLESIAEYSGLCSP